MGRNAKSADLHIAQGNPNRLTKEELAARKEAEVKLGAADLSKVKPPDFVQNDVVAFKHWKQHIKEYKDAAKAGIEVLTTADIGQLALYCKTFSEYESLLKIRQRIESATDSENEVNKLAYEEKLSDIMQRQLQFILSVDGMLKLETAINKKMDMLIKMQDRLFLNPLARVKNVPKREKKKPENPMESEFDV